MSTLINRVYYIADSEHMTEEHRRLDTIFLQNDYKKPEIEQAFKKYKRQSWRQGDSEDDFCRGVAVILFCNTVTNH